MRKVTTASCFQENPPEPPFYKGGARGDLINGEPGTRCLVPHTEQLSTFPPLKKGGLGGFD